MKTYKQLKESVLSDYTDYNVNCIMEFCFDDSDYLRDPSFSPADEDLEDFLDNVDVSFVEKFKNNYFAWLLCKTKNSILREDIYASLDTIYTKNFFTIIDNIHSIANGFTAYVLNGDGDDQGEGAKDSLLIIDENTVVFNISNRGRSNEEYKEAMSDLKANLEKIGSVCCFQYVSDKEYAEIYDEYCEMAYGGNDNTLKIKSDVPEPGRTYTPEYLGLDR